ncbi:MAG: hypothetical protein H2057_05370 [Alphaproteobacteria bacterium]|nr:hypothetical protein [Alphaproteobacteria bacterium]
MRNFLKIPLGILMSTSFFYQSVSAGHFYNVDDENQLKSGVVLNHGFHMGFSDDIQATLISPRLAVTATHGNFKGQDMPYHTNISFYGKEYRIIHVIEHPKVMGDGQTFHDLFSCDLTVYILSEDVTHPDGGRVACPLGKFDPTKELPDREGSYYAHSLSHSPFIRLGNFHSKFSNVDSSMLYGKTNLAKTTFDDDEFAQAEIRTYTDHPSTDPSLMVPVGGDSGSGLFMPLKEGGYAYIGVMARIYDEDSNPYGSGHYTPMSQQINWLRDTENSLIARSIIPDTVQRFEVATQDQWDFTPHAAPDLQPLYKKFNPISYLALNPDILEAYADLPWAMALAKAMSHKETQAVTEERRIYLSEGLGDPALGTQDTLNPAVYLALNPDLQNVFRNGTLRDALHQAREHFYKHGKNEARSFMLGNTKHRPDVVTLPYDFSPKGYLRLNPDIALEAETKNVDPIEFAKLNYKNTGFKDTNRRYILPIPRDFRYGYFMYFALNPDLKILMNGKESHDAMHEGSRHYTTVGFLEDRTYKYDGLEKRAPIGDAFTMPEDFDAALYLALNKDLITHYEIESGYKITYDELLQKGEEHYRNHGGPEDGRRYR